MHRTTPAGTDIFDDLGRSPEKAASLKIRRDLMRALVDAIEERGLTQQKAAEVFGVSQPRVSDLVRGRISQFTIDALVSMLARAGIEVAISIGLPAPAERAIELGMRQLTDSFPPEVRAAFQKIHIQPVNEAFALEFEDAPAFNSDSRHASFYQRQIIH